MIDLHLHSTCSDGSLSPTELVDHAAALSLTAISLNDHDTVGGIPEFLEAAAGRLAAVGGVEISVDHSPGTLHLLGYYVDPAHRDLADALSRLRAGREDRNDRILERLRALDMPITQEAVHQFCGDDVVGRPHIAKAMVAAGYVKDTRAAFDRFLGKGRPAYCDRYRLKADEAMSLVLAAGGIPVLSHPFTLDMRPPALERFVAELVACGLQGIEVYYPEHQVSQTEHYLALTERFDLVPTGGTDFHGSLNPKLHMGSGFGGFSVPDSVYAALAERHASMCV